MCLSYRTKHEHLLADSVYKLANLIDLQMVVSINVHLQIVVSINVHLQMVVSIHFYL
jgi:hypothetical protein